MKNKYVSINIKIINIIKIMNLNVTLKHLQI
jgi:hypothetical protein